MPHLARPWSYWLWKQAPVCNFFHESLHFFPKDFISSFRIALAALPLLVCLLMKNLPTGHTSSSSLVHLLTMDLCLKVITAYCVPPHLVVVFPVRPCVLKLPRPWLSFFDQWEGNSIYGKVFWITSIIFDNNKFW